MIHKTQDVVIVHIRIKCFEKYVQSGKQINLFKYNTIILIISTIFWHISILHSAIWELL